MSFSLNLQEKNRRIPKNSDSNGLIGKKALSTSKGKQPLFLGPTKYEDFRSTPKFSS